jgi:hypothetical protein
MLWIFGRGNSSGITLFYEFGDPDEIILTCYSTYEECIFIFINEIMFFFSREIKKYTHNLIKLIVELPMDMTISTCLGASF